MPVGLFTDGAKRVMLREYEDLSLQARQYRLRPEFGSIKHGAGFHLFSGHSPFEGRVFDEKERLFVPSPAKVRYQQT